MVAADADTESSAKRAGICPHSAPANIVLNYKIKLKRKTSLIITETKENKTGSLTHLLPACR
jgi:hypothetical protein